MKKLLVNNSADIVSARRHFLASGAMGLSSVALSWLLRQERAFAVPAKPKSGPQRYDLLPKNPAHQPRATAMISLFMQGGPSQVDLFDPKPELTRYNGKPYPHKVKYDNAAQASSTCFGSPWKFARQGQCGMELSELVPNLAKVADDITLIRSMQTGVNNHVQAIDALNTGQIQKGRPALGSWFTYGLGNASASLPAFLVLTDPRGLPVAGVRNWSNGSLPSLYQGTVVRPKEPRILNLDAPKHIDAEVQRRYLDYLDRLNRQHLQQYPGESDLAARISSYELAAKMQDSAREALNIGQESKATLKLYGTDDAATKDFGTRCLIARRLVERGVRFVQLFTGNQTWDHHGSIRSGLPAACRYTDKPSVALVQDLKSRGLLDTTIVHWGGEMGRLPVIQNDTGAAKVGRDHNTYGFSMWLAGGGFRGGYVHGTTDDFGHHAVEGIVTHHDYHATLLHLFGLDPEKLVFQSGPRTQELVKPQEGKVVYDLLS
ncbi:MAG: DUF1501 domain-containing protein [Pirellulales bacterium]